VPRWKNQKEGREKLEDVAQSNEKKNINQTRGKEKFELFRGIDTNCSGRSSKSYL